MAKVKISEFSSTPGNNTDIDGINIAENCAPSGINDAIRELMAQLKDFQAGTAGDSFNGPVGTTTAAAGAFTTLTTSSTVTHNGGTANGVAYLNGSKVLTTGSALTFDGSTFGTTASLVDVNGVSLYPTLRFRSSSNTSTTFVVGRESGASFFTNSGNSPFYWSIDGSEQMRLTSTGLGIGTSSPSYKLDVSGAARTSNAGNVNYILSDGSVQSSMQHNSNAFYFNANESSATNGSFIWRSSISFTERMRLDSSGNLGLGVTPSAWANDFSSKAIQVGPATALYGYSAGISHLTTNAVYEPGAWKYINSTFASDYLQQSGGHAWFTAPSGTAGDAISFTQAMSLLSTGALVLGDTSVVASGFAGVKFNGSSFNGLGLNDSSATSGAGYIYFQSNGTTIGSITRVASTSAVAYNTTSDARIKHNIVDAPDASALIDGIKVRSFNWNSDNSLQRYGFIAQELVAVAPEAVYQPVDIEHMMAVDYSKLVPMLVKELQSLRKRVAELEAK